MKNLNDVIRRLIELRGQGTQITLLAVCPNSAAVTEAAVQVAEANHMPMLLAATLNQVDRDGGYTGWRPGQFVARLREYARRYHWDGPLYPCLDHGGPWLKDAHSLARLSLSETMAEVKASLVACLEAGYQLLHIDPTVDRTLPPGEIISIDTVVARTVELIEYVEQERARQARPPIAYEVGTEEVHGGLVDYDNFARFLTGLRQGLADRGLVHVWPCFIVGKVGTDLATTYFDPQAANHLYQLVAPLGSLIKGHYSDWVANPEAYPETGMGGANFGPELTAVEYLAIADLCAREADLHAARPGLALSNFIPALEKAVFESDRWQKWLQDEERLPGGAGAIWAGLTPERRAWLTQTGSRYVWTVPEVIEARQALYHNLTAVLPDPNQVVVDRIALALERYVTAFHLFDSLELLS